MQKPPLKKRIEKIVRVSQLDMYLLGTIHPWETSEPIIIQLMHWKNVSCLLDIQCIDIMQHCTVFQKQWNNLEFQ